MAENIAQLLSRKDIATNDPATEAEIDLISNHFNRHLPEAIVHLWRRSAGLSITPLRIDLLGPCEVWQFVGEKSGLQAWQDAGFLPVFYDRQSNYLAIVAKAPLAFRVAHLPHDGDSSLVYADFESCIKNLLQVLNDGGGVNAFFSGARGDYPPDGARPLEDQKAARAMLATPNDHGEWSYAAQLLDDSNLPEWSRLLETDHFVRRNVRARMRRMKSPAIRQLLQMDQKLFADFAALVTNSAREAGFEVGERKADVLKVNGKWMNLDAFFHRRSIPNAMPRLMQWIEDVSQGRNPNHRPENYKSDK